MTQSLLRKNRTTTVKTNLSVAWFDATGIASNVAETGDLIYVVPRKAEAEFKSMLWTYSLESDPIDQSIVYTIINHGRNETLLLTNELQLVQRSLLTAQLTFRSLTAVGVIKTSETKQVNMNLTLSRRTNLQSDNDFSIVAAYITTVTSNVSSSGVLFLEEKLFQDIFADDLDEWRGYTFEESAASQ